MIKRLLNLNSKIMNIASDLCQKMNFNEHNIYDRLENMYPKYFTCQETLDSPTDLQKTSSYMRKKKSAFGGAFNRQQSIGKKKSRNTIFGAKKPRYSSTTIFKPMAAIIDSEASNDEAEINVKRAIGEALTDVDRQVYAGSMRNVA